MSSLIWSLPLVLADVYGPTCLLIGAAFYRLLRGGNSQYRLGVYSFYLEHPDINERAKYLANYHGDSGYHGGNDNITYGGKGLSFSHGSITEIGRAHV